MEIAECQNDECEQDFERKKHNQIYCSDECRRVATNKRLMERYYERKDRLARKLEHSVYCKCGTIISRYNESGRCFNCLQNGNVDNAALLTQILKL